jgi:hypothetical protein
MKVLALSKGFCALLDDDDHDRLAHLGWRYRADNNGKPGYVVRNVKIDGKWRYEYLHRHLMDPPPKHECIFLNHNHLDCRRSNLKVVNTSAARRHHRVRQESQTGIKGVRYDRRSKGWQATITDDEGRVTFLGAYSTAQKAKDEYEQRFKEMFPDLPSPYAQLDDPLATMVVNPDDAVSGTPNVATESTPTSSA